MKLRIDPKKISFRLDLDEVGILLKEGRLQAKTPLPDGELCYEIICLPPGSPSDFQTDFQKGSNIFTLWLARDIIEAHIARLPSLRGIICRFPTRDGDMLDVSLEVNLKKKIKRSLK